MCHILKLILTASITYLLLTINTITKILAACYYQVMYEFQSKSTLYSWLNVKQHLA